jgi:hypothetical protein
MLGSTARIKRAGQTHENFSRFNKGHGVSQGRSALRLYRKNHLERTIVNLKIGLCVCPGKPATPHPLA